MARRLPPLNGLRLLEAAGRHLSFKSAAEELGITASAVSHGIQSLEDWLGVPLFARTGRGLALTDAGADFLPAVREVLTLLASATEQVPSDVPRSRLAVSASPAFAARLLLPRLARFTARHPLLRVDIDTSQRTVEFPRDGFDVAIRLGQGEWRGLVAAPLLKEVLVPVCSPDLRQKLEPSALLCDMPLIHLTSVSEDWSTWARATGSDPIDGRRGLMVDTIEMAIEGAVRGHGVLLGRRPFVDQELNAGTLVSLGLPAARTQAGYWLVGLPETMARPQITEFCHWLQYEMSEVQTVPPAWRSCVGLGAAR